MLKFNSFDFIPQNFKQSAHTQQRRSRQPCRQGLTSHKNQPLNTHSPTGFQTANAKVPRLPSVAKCKQNNSAENKNVTLKQKTTPF